jgi:hypothetical protein
MKKRRRAVKKSKVLTAAELECLLEVPTTVRMAKTILRRNQAILKALGKDDSTNIKIGCPHCMKAGGNEDVTGECARCTYPVLGGESEYELRCLNYSFGGSTLRDFEGISLQADSAYVCPSEILDIGEEEMAKAVAWTKGHIEWAREVIRRGRKKGK